MQLYLEFEMFAHYAKANRSAPIKKTMLADLFKIIGLYLGVLILLVGLVKLILSFRNRYISFVITIKRLIIAALVGNLLSFIIYKIFMPPGTYWWGDLPNNYIIVQGIIAFLPIICVTLALIWTLKKQFREAE